MGFVNAARQTAVVPAHARGHAHHFAHHARGAHHARRAERDVRDGDVASRHEEVRHIPRVEAAVRDRIGIVAVVRADRAERLAVVVLRVARHRVVEIDRPCRAARTVRIRHEVEHVLLRENVVAHQTAALALARHVGHPLKFAACVLFPLCGFVLQVGPVRVHDEHPVVADTLELADLVAHHPRLPVPVTPQAVFAILLVEGDHPRLGGERDGTPGVLRVPLHRRAHRHRIGHVRRHVLTRLGLRLASHAEVGAGERAHAGVARAVCEKRCLECSARA